MIIIIIFFINLLRHKKSFSLISLVLLHNTTQYSIRLTIIFFYLQNSDLIEVLWKQDVDLGFSLPQTESKKEPPLETKKVNDEIDEIEKLQALLDVKDDEVRIL